VNEAAGVWSNSSYRIGFPGPRTSQQRSVSVTLAGGQAGSPACGDTPARAVVERPSGRRQRLTLRRRCGVDGSVKRTAAVVLPAALPAAARADTTRTPPSLLGYDDLLDDALLTGKATA
jgi:hypothetical protein